MKHIDAQILANQIHSGLAKQSKLGFGEAWREDF